MNPTVKEKLGLAENCSERDYLEAVNEAVSKIAGEEKYIAGWDCINPEGDGIVMSAGTKAACEKWQADTVKRFPDSPYKDYTIKPWYRYLHDYPNDLNAAARVEEKLKGWELPCTGEALRYFNELLDLCLVEKPARMVVRATALQRCEAVILTMT